MWTRGISLCFAAVAVTLAACWGGGGGRTATETSLSEPGAVAVDSSGAVYIADTGHCTVWRITDEKAKLIVGKGVCGGQPSGSTELLREAGGVAVAADGTVYVSDTPNCLVRAWRDETLSTIAGTGDCAFGGDGAAAAEARLNTPSGLAVDATGTLYVADAGNCRVRQIRDGVISTVAGSERCGYAGDGGPAAEAELDDPVGVAVDAQGRVYIVEAGNCRVRVVADGTITTFAGDGNCGFGDAVADPAAAGLGFPRGIAVAGDGSVLIADTHGCRILAVREGAISVIAGDSRCGVGGDGGPALAAQLDLPGSVAAAANGDVYIADTQNCSIRLVREGNISTVAGKGSC